MAVELLLYVSQAMIRKVVVTFFGPISIQISGRLDGSAEMLSCHEQHALRTEVCTGPMKIGDEVTPQVHLYGAQMTSA